MVKRQANSTDFSETQINSQQVDAMYMRDGTHQRCRSDVVRPRSPVHRRTRIDESRAQSPRPRARTVTTPRPPHRCRYDRAIATALARRHRPVRDRHLTVYTHTLTLTCFHTRTSRDANTLPETR
ncbi:hypothetical protein EVAR_51774_1 [Eumeta japonica]|uniref:Uncharacterized protein n=1 Tax=Eumeta variegata TaxID=151549 RepID=A0A4C1XC62_EUMVA|nr:hypothetical protein EVAR_51774_1 [Eumeta japonica]